MLVSGALGGEVKVWDMRTGKLMTTLIKGGCRVNALRIMGKRHIFVGYVTCL